MCGIFGFTLNKNFRNSYNSEKISKKLLSSLAKFSEARGKDSSGICLKDYFNKKHYIFKGNLRVSELIKKKTFSENFKKVFLNFDENKTNNFSVFGHARLVTNGSQLKQINNQPVIKDDIIIIHNGIIVNSDSLFEQFSIEKKFDIDTEIIPSLINHFLDKNCSFIDSVVNSLNQLQGTFSISIYFEKFNQIILATNNGSLYYASDRKDIFLFSSERYILDSSIKSSLHKKLNVNQLNSNEILILDPENINYDIFNFTTNNSIRLESINVSSFKNKLFLFEENNKKEISKVVDIDSFKLEKDYSHKQKLLEYNHERISKIKRCSKCLLPETFPYIFFNVDGCCNYCTNYVKRNTPKSLNDLKKLVSPYKSKNNSLDCIVPFSGGRDSTYVLHFVKKELGLNPLAYTYDWGMVTDLGRRNIARVCGKLGVENVIVAADINTKRNNIKMNIEAWLKQPDLGMIPLFMAGDKQFFKHANILKKRTDIDLNIWGINFLENTDFKVGFCGVPPDWNKKMIYSMSLKRKSKLFIHVGKNFLKNPRYINTSLFDTFDSFLSRYMNPRKDYYHFFDYFNWDETEIDDLLYNEYNWEKSKDLKSSWRIGDGTASFYNYIYFTVAGFSEFDTFRSNQIREGMISRDKALELVLDENKPRYDSLRWYIEILGLDFEETIKTINNIPKLYN